MSAIGARQHLNTTRQISICLLFHSIICQVAKLSIFHIAQSYCRRYGCCIRRCCHNVYFPRVSTHFSCNRSRSFCMHGANEVRRAVANKKNKRRKKARQDNKRLDWALNICWYVSSVVIDVERKLHFLCCYCCRQCRPWAHWAHFRSILYACIRYIRVCLPSAYIIDRHSTCYKSSFIPFAVVDCQF